MYFLPRISRDRRARAIKTGHCASRLTTRRARRLSVDAVQQKERGEQASGSIYVGERAAIDGNATPFGLLQLAGRTNLRLDWSEVRIRKMINYGEACTCSGYPRLNGR